MRYRGISKLISVCSDPVCHLLRGVAKPITDCRYVCGLFGNRMGPSQKWSISGWTLISVMALTGIASTVGAAPSGRFVSHPEEMWTFDSGSPIYGDSSVVDNTVYMANTAGTVYALDSDTGDVRWQYQSDGPIYGGVNTYDTSVYVLSDDGYSYKLDAEDGELLWRVATPNDAERNPLLEDFGTWDYRSSAPVEKDGYVYVASGNGVVYALEKNSGDVIWQVQTDSIIRIEPAVTDQYVVVGTFGGIIYCLDRLTGVTVWEYDTRTGLDDSPRDYTINSPASVHSDTVYIGTRNTHLYALDLATGAVKWMYPYVSSWAESPISFYDGTVYAGSSFLRAQFAFSADDGELQWMHNKIHGLSYSALQPTEDALYTGTVAVPGMQYEGFLTDGGILKLDRLTGEREWFYAVPQSRHLNEFGVISSPVIDNDRVYFGALDGTYRSLVDVKEEFPILSFTADRDELKRGEKTVLRWKVIGGHRVYLNGRRVRNEGMRVVKAKADTLYTLSAIGRLREEQQLLLDVKPVAEINIAKFGDATATSTEDGLQHGAQNAIDGDMTTRWASAFQDGESITLDLGQEFALERIVLNWEGAYASVYRIEGSIDQEHWVPIYQTENGVGGREEILDLQAEARFVRLTSDERATVYGTSLYEIEVYEQESRKTCSVNKHKNGKGHKGRQSGHRDQHRNDKHHKHDKDWRWDKKDR